MASFGFLLLSLATVLAAQNRSAKPEFKELDGRSVSLDAYRGKIVVLNFWATWCTPCKEEMPLLVDLKRKYGDRIDVIAVSVDDAQTAANIPDFAKKYKMGLPIWRGDMKLAESLGLGEAVPATAFIDENGKIVGRVLGMLDKHDLTHRVAWMLGDRSGKEPVELVNSTNKSPTRSDSPPPPPF
jgi:thiol-disulfide isomerase/thioredoxin